MDRVIQKKKWNNKRILTLCVIVFIVSLLICVYYLTSGKSKINVDTGRITISTISRGPFRVAIPVNGIVLPVTTIYLDAVEGGRVEKVFVEDGADMKKGDPILKLSNTDLELSLATQETSVFNLLTQMQISRNAARQNTVSKLNQMADVDDAFNEAERVYKLYKELFERKVIAAQEYKKAQLTYNYQLKRKKLTALILKQDTVSTKEEAVQSKQSFQRTQNALAVMRRKVDDLTVRAPVDGQLTSLDADIGQNKNKGERLGQIDILSGFKVRLDIDEHYISQIYSGLTGTFTLADKRYKLVIKKIFTQVKNGKFQVDMLFQGQIPKNIRRGQTLQVLLALSDETKQILLPKGGFYQQSGGNWIFKLNNDGKSAYRVNIQLGRQNLDYYEVLDGLKPGDKVVTSSYENYGDMQELKLNN